VRGVVAGLETPHPLAAALPALYQDDELAQRFLSAFDDVFAPVLCTLDNIDAYFDPLLAPVDFLAWLGSWVGLTIDENWPPERERALVAEAARLFRWRGTVKGLAAHLALYLGTSPEIHETGGVSWSAIPGAPIPDAAAHLTVIVRVPDPASVDMARIHAIIVASKPAHVTHELRVEAG
jgi:phage tail-like protein